MKKCVVVIPIYKESIEKDEKSSLLQCKNILNKYDIKFVCPEQLDTSEYENIVDFEVVRLKNAYFEDTHSYSRMLLDKAFYEQFKEYEYMLIYQLDAWVFEDKLQEWCNKGYDYIGAPWFKGFGAAKKNSKMFKYAGNGGFSLRKISTFIEILSHAENSDVKIKTFKEIYTKAGQSSIFNVFRISKSIKRYLSEDNKLKVALKTTNDCEDSIIANNLRRIYPQLNVAEAKDAKFFAFEVLPNRLFEECGKKLPFGCHAFKKYDWDFWKEYIKTR